MPAPTFTYTMKNLDRAFWQRVKAEAASRGVSVRTLIDQLLHALLDARAPSMQQH